MKSKSTISVTFLPTNKIVEASQDETLLEACLNSGIDISHSCGGNGTCGTCRVLIIKGSENLPPRNEIENEIASERNFKDYERLSCQNYPLEGLIIEIPGSEITGL